MPNIQTPQLDFAALTNIPALGAMNTGLTAALNPQMLHLLGAPSSEQTHDCSPITDNAHLESLMESAYVGPFRVTGLRPAVQALARIFARVKSADPRLYEEVKTAGMQCTRLVRGSSRYWSNHSWGTAIDLYFGSDVTDYGSPKTYVGILKLYPYFHAERFYWGAEFPRRDSMHMECSLELLRDWKAQGVI